MSTSTLNGERLDALLQHLGRGGQGAGGAYLDLRKRLVKFFEWRGAAGESDALADEALDRVARKLGEGVPVENVSAYALTVARNVWLEHLKRERREAAALERAPAPPTPEEGERAARRLECFEACLAGLGDDERELIVAYHQGEGAARAEGRKRLSKQMGIELNALRIRAHRVRVRLEECVAACLAR